MVVETLSIDTINANSPYEVKSMLPYLCTVCVVCF